MKTIEDIDCLFPSTLEEALCTVPPDM